MGEQEDGGGGQGETDLWGEEAQERV